MIVPNFVRFAAGIILLSSLTAAEDDKDHHQCHELYEHDASVKGTISSPFYGERPKYHKGLWCEYRIRAPKGYTIKLTFKEFDIHYSSYCRDDGLYIYGKDKQNVIDNVCGSELPPPVLSKDEINLVFRTSDSKLGKGFLLEYESAPDYEPCEPGYTQCRNRVCYKNEKRCDGINDCGDWSDEEDCFPEDDKDHHQCHELYEHDASVKGTVSSPFYGKRPEYHSGLWCEYRIRAPEGYTIKVTFKDLDLDPSSGCSQDILVVYGKDKQSVLGNFCGSLTPQPMLSNEGENEIRLLFRTDYMKGGRGFLLEYESAPHIELCESGYTVCGNRVCYKNEKKCDGVDDCGDGTDEENCNLPIITNPTECGVQAIKPKSSHDSPDRLVGGDVVIPNSWPWQVSLQTRYSEPNGHFCGGTIINAQWILTATHCVVNNPHPGQIKVVVGAHGKFTKTEYEQIRSSAKVISYHNLEGDKIREFSMTHDISLIKLNAPITFNKGVQPACLPQLGWKVPIGTSCVATGWGETRGSGGSESLKQMEQITQARANCGFDENTQICVAKPQNSPCHGDSGGPINCPVGDKWYVFGAASFVTTTNFMSGLCTGPGAMTVYASAADKADWIKTVIEKYS